MNKFIYTMLLFSCISAIAMNMWSNLILSILCLVLYAHTQSLLRYNYFLSHHIGVMKSLLPDYDIKANNPTRDEVIRGANGNS